MLFFVMLYLDLVSPVGGTTVWTSLTSQGALTWFFCTCRMGDVNAQAELETSLYNKTVRTNARGEAEIIMMDECISVYKFVGDLMFYVLGDVDENEILLADVLMGFCDSITLLLRNAVEKKTVLENLDLVLLAMDEITEGGLILETDPAIIATRVTM